MIPKTAPTLQPESWQTALREMVTDSRELFALLELDPTQLPGALNAQATFAVRVPHPFLARIRKGDANDPLLLQVLPHAHELLTVTGFGDDPVGDIRANVLPGLLHKYEGRVLLIVSGACAVNCRYCFRREFAYENNNPGRLGWEQALTYIAKDTSIEEVILSGGDPLVVPNNQLEWLINRIGTIPHVQRLRIHTRLPVVIPARVDDGLVATLADTRLPVACVIHANHAHEIDTSVVAALDRLRAIGNVTLLNQSVLLRGVNDSCEALAQLSKTLFAAGVLPYYLHQLDRAQGTAHFEVTDQQAGLLMEQLLKVLPGYLVPRLVREEAGRPSKTPLILKN